MQNWCMSRVCLNLNLNTSGSLFTTCKLHQSKTLCKEKSWNVEVSRCYCPRFLVQGTLSICRFSALQVVHRQRQVEGYSGSESYGWALWGLLAQVLAEGMIWIINSKPTCHWAKQTLVTWARLQGRGLVEYFYDYVIDPADDYPDSSIPQPFNCNTTERIVRKVDFMEFASVSNSSEPCVWKFFSRCCRRCHSWHRKINSKHRTWSCRQRRKDWLILLKELFGNFFVCRGFHFVWYFIWYFLRWIKMKTMAKKVRLA